MTHQELENKIRSSEIDFGTFLSKISNQYFYFGINEPWAKYYFYLENEFSDTPIWFSDPYHIVDSAFDPILPNLTYQQETYIFWGWNLGNIDGAGMLYYNGTIIPSDFKENAGGILCSSYNSNIKLIQEIEANSINNTFDIKDPFSIRQATYLNNSYFNGQLLNASCKIVANAIIPFQKVSLLAHDITPTGYDFIGYARDNNEARKVFTNNSAIERYCTYPLSQITKDKAKLERSTEPYYEVYKLAAPVDLEYHLLNNKKLYYHNYTKVYYANEVAGLHLSGIDSIWQIDANTTDLSSTELYHYLFGGDNYPGWEPIGYGLNTANIILSKEDFINNNFENITSNFPSSALTPQQKFELFYKPMDSLKILIIKNEDTDEIYSLYYAQDKYNTDYYYSMDETEEQYKAPKFKTDLRVALNKYVDNKNLHLSPAPFFSQDGKRKKFIGFFDSDNNKIIDEKGKKLINSLENIELLIIKYEESELEINSEQYFYINNNKIYWEYDTDDTLLLANEDDNFLNKKSDSDFIQDLFPTDLKGLNIEGLYFDKNLLLKRNEFSNFFDRQKIDLQLYNKKVLHFCYELPSYEEGGFNKDTHYFYFDTALNKKVYWQYQLEEYQDGDEIKTKKNTYLYVESPSLGYNLLENEPLFSIPTEVPNEVINSSENYSSDDYEFVGYFTKQKVGGTRYFNDKMQLVNLITEKVPLLSSETEPVILYARYGLKGVPDLDFEIEDLDGIRAVQVGPYDPQNEGNLTQKDYYKIVTSGNFDKITANILQLGFAVLEYKDNEDNACLTLTFLDDTNIGG